MTPPSGDRAVQDEVIRALADAPYRASAAWQRRHLADPDRVERYARFLARHFYYERVVHFFKYSRALARVTGRRPDAILHQGGFDALLPTMVLGDRGTARSVARLAVEYVAPGATAVPFLPDLLRYEEAMMVAEAGPRRWRETGQQPEATGQGVTLVAVEGTVLLSLTYDLPVVLARLLEPWTEPPQPPARPTSLLVARSPQGRVAVARSDAAVAAVVGFADGTRTLAQLAADTGLPLEDLEAAVRGLVDLGAVRFSTGS
ncbi:MAG TPA: hypothetical protein VH158_08975 [Gemmatimonadales bacterium]|nr:hypothetical protein [Gemmatimonadales bacterium]